jgi:hypothetical protein
MRETRPIILEVMALVAILGGCTGDPASEAREVAPGIYSIRFAATTLDGAVRKAAEYCRAKGQNSSIQDGGGQYEILFRCVPSGEVAPR